MRALTELDYSKIVNWIKTNIQPWIELLLKNDPFMLYKIIILLLLIIILNLMKKNHKTSRQIPEGIKGYKNFKGETWYSNGWVHDEKNNKWEAPNLPKSGSQKPSNEYSPSGWHWNEIEGIWEPPDIIVKESNERWRWDNIRGVWIDLNKKDE